MFRSPPPGLASDCWKAAWRSLLAVGGITSVVGLFFIPAEIEKLTSSVEFCVRQCELSGDATFAAIESRIHPQTGSGRENRLVAYQWRDSVAHRTVLDCPLNPVCLASHPVGFPVFVGGTNGEIRAVGAPSSGWNAALLGRHAQGHATRLACTADGSTLVSSDLACLYVWNLDRWKLRWCMAGGEVVCWDLCPDSQQLVCCRVVGQEHVVQMLDLATGSATTIFRCRQGAWRSLQVGSRGTTIIGVNAEGWLRVWRKTNESGPWQLASVPMIEPLPDELYALSPDEMHLVAAQGRESCLQIWNLSSGEPARRLAMEEGDVPLGMRFVSVDKLLVWGSPDALQVWEFSRSDRALAIPRSEDNPQRSWSTFLFSASLIE